MVGSGMPESRKEETSFSYTWRLRGPTDCPSGAPPEEVPLMKDILGLLEMGSPCGMCHTKEGGDLSGKRGSVACYFPSQLFWLLHVKSVTDSGGCTTRLAHV